MSGLVVLFVLGACANGSTASGQRSDVVESGIGIVAEGCSLVGRHGSGVVLERQGQVVTVAHTISGASAITVIDSDGNEFPATVRSFDKNADLAVLDVIDLDAPHLRLAPASTGAGGALTWDREEGVRYISADVTKRLAITIEDIYVGEVVERSGLEVVADIAVGDSGGPILNRSGDVIGIIYAKSRDRAGIAFATDTDQIRATLASASTGAVDNGRCV